MIAFGCVPRASVCPCARWVEAKTSPSSIAWQTPTATASWPIATCRNPGSSPARNCSSTFSSKRLINSISRRNSRSRSSDRPRFVSTFAICIEFMLSSVALVDQWKVINSNLAEGWTDVQLRLTVEDQPERAAALLAPAGAGRRGNVVMFGVGRGGVGTSPDLVTRLLARLDAERIRGVLAPVKVEEVTPAGTRSRRASLGEQWEQAQAALPADWSDLYAELELDSSDYLERGALLLAPANPARVKARLAYRFRVA